jgi:hypothetical protein
MCCLAISTAFEDKNATIIVCSAFPPERIAIVRSHQATRVFQGKPLIPGCLQSTRATSAQKEGAAASYGTFVQIVHANVWAALNL